ncbi:MAG: shikimate dehydrogenase [Caldilineaceae bacterium]|nr:shikimate dehydrogenase [Caldilineaceae bacterium]HRJ40418.1 shikimate dehydrogenase [Caldilineaceae bacterium]
MTQPTDPLPTDITASTTLVGLIGWPISHSVSPVMHNAAFAELRMNWRYVPLPVRPERIGEAVAGVRALGLRGVNVTVPHKQAVMPFLDRWSPAAAAIGAVNTILVGEDGELLGDNTDAAGFVTDLRANGVDPAGQRVVVVGAGGSARAIVYGLAEAGCGSLVLLNRTLDKAESLLASMREIFPDVPMTARPFPDGVAESASEADLIVNCTSLGMSPNLEGLPWDEDVEFHAGQTVYDLVYNPAVTRLLQLASVDGATVIGGLGMLIHQGAIAFERWTGEAAPVDVMQRAVNVVFDR